MASYQLTGGDIIGLDNPAAGSLVLASSLANFTDVNTDPIRMFARRDAFRTVAEAIASAIAGVPWNLYQRDQGNGRTKVWFADHPVARALDAPLAPPARATQFRFVEALQLDFVLHDRWLVLMVDDDEGRLEFVRIPARFVSFIIDGLRRVTGARVYKNGLGSGQFIDVPINECLYDVGYDPSDPSGLVAGYPIARTLAASANELDKGAAFRNAILDGGPKVPMFISRPVGAPAWIKSGERARFIADFKSYNSENAGQVPILEDGMELKSAPQLGADSIEYRETRREAQIEFAIAMHFPPELVGYRPGTNSNVEALREQLYVDVLGSRFAAFRQALVVGLRASGRLTDDYYVEENLSARLAGTPEKQAAITQTQVGRPTVTVNEARKQQNLPPIEGGDLLVIPLNVTAVGGELASPNDTGPAKLELSVAAGGRDASAGAPRRLAISAAGRSLAAAYSAQENKMLDRFTRDLQKFYKAQGKRAAAAVGTGDAPGPISEGINLEVENPALAAIVLPHSYALAQAGSQRILNEYDPESENFDPEVMLPWLSKGADNFANQINTAALAAATTAIFSGEGWIDKLAELYQRLVDEQADVWGNTIATSAINFGGNDAAKANNLTLKTWVHTPSSKSRSEHEALDGVTVAFDEVFPNGGRWPGDPVLGADENANCHCRVVYSKDES